MSFLEEFISSISFLPTEVQRSLEVIKHLDKKVEDIQTEFNALSSQYFQSLRKQGNNTVEDKSLYTRLEDLHQQALNLTEEKLIISQQLKAVLEPCMKRLDKDLEEFRGRLAFETSNDPIRRRRADPFGGMEDLNPYFTEDPYAGQDSDKAYCFCNGPSRGNMVACDGPNCAREWFHFECVGLSTMPDGDWFCQECKGSV